MLLIGAVAQCMWPMMQTTTHTAVANTSKVTVAIHAQGLRLALSDSSLCPMVAAHTIPQGKLPAAPPLRHVTIMCPCASNSYDVGLLQSCCSCAARLLLLPQ